MFRRVAPQALAEETLTQRSVKPAPRFHPRAGSGAVSQPALEYQTREVISEYSLAAFKESPEKLHEFRQVISVDGRQIRTAESARYTLGMDLRSDDDRARKRMLEDFQKCGLAGAAADFGQLILLFTKRQLHDYDFRVRGNDRIGADTATVLHYEQRQGSVTFLVFEGRKTVRAKLDGDLWVRQSDALPLRISIRSEWVENRHRRRHDAIVEYTPTPFGIIAPASVKHTEHFDDHLITENVFRYSPFRKFGADAEIKFETGAATNSK